jgi:membrane protease subunit HflK
VIPLAEGEKDQRIREGEGYRLKRVKGAEGDAATTVSRRNWR